MNHGKWNPAIFLSANSSQASFKDSCLRRSNDSQRAADALIAVKMRWQYHAFLRTAEVFCCEPNAWNLLQMLRNLIILDVSLIDIKSSDPQELWRRQHDAIAKKLYFDGEKIHKTPMVFGVVDFFLFWTALGFSGFSLGIGTTISKSAQASFPHRSWSQACWFTKRTFAPSPRSIFTFGWKNQIVAI